MDRPHYAATCVALFLAACGTSSIPLDDRADGGVRRMSEEPMLEGDRLLGQLSFEEQVELCEWGKRERVAASISEEGMCAGLAASQETSPEACERTKGMCLQEGWATRDDCRQSVREEDPFPRGECAATVTQLQTCVADNYREQALWARENACDNPTGTGEPPSHEEPESCRALVEICPAIGQ